MSKGEEDGLGELIANAASRMMLVEVSFQLGYDEAIEVIQYVKKFKSQEEKKEI